MLPDVSPCSTACGFGQVTHPTDSSLVAEAVLPVLPDFECWHNQCAAHSPSLRDEPWPTCPGSSLLPGGRSKASLLLPRLHSLFKRSAEALRIC
eukprot:6197688-Pleurochrysis_carterae.AAC.2